MKNRSNIDIVLFLRNKEIELMNRHYEIIMNDPLDFENTQLMNEKHQILKEFKEKIFKVLELQMKLDREVDKLLDILEEL